MRLVEGGLLMSLLAGRRGRVTNSPLQFGHLPPRTVSAHDAQNVHSNEQIRASVESGGKSLSQHSQLGLSSSISFSWQIGWKDRGPRGPTFKVRDATRLYRAASPAPQGLANKHNLPRAVCSVCSANRFLNLRQIKATSHRQQLWIPQEQCP